jgi:hypothetical protein
MGKSSLRVRTMRRLQDSNIACVVIDVTAIGTQQVRLIAGSRNSGHNRQQFEAANQSTIVVA